MDKEKQQTLVIECPFVQKIYFLFQHALGVQPPQGPLDCAEAACSSPGLFLPRTRVNSPKE
jgi:hypothetical protein